MQIQHVLQRQLVQTEDRGNLFDHRRVPETCHVHPGHPGLSVNRAQLIHADVLILHALVGRVEEHVDARLGRLRRGDEGARRCARLAASLNGEELGSSHGHCPFRFRQGW